MHQTNNLIPAQMEMCGLYHYLMTKEKKHQIQTMMRYLRRTLCETQSVVRQLVTRGSNLKNLLPP